jgi:hypothetical protein
MSPMERMPILVMGFMLGSQDYGVCGVRMTEYELTISSFDFFLRELRYLWELSSLIGRVDSL